MTTTGKTFKEEKWELSLHTDYPPGVFMHATEIPALPRWLIHARMENVAGNSIRIHAVEIFGCLLGGTKIPRKEIGSHQTGNQSVAWHL